MKKLTLYESTYNELKAVRDKLTEILKDEELPRLSYSKGIETAWRWKKGIVNYHVDYKPTGDKKSITINHLAVKILLEMRHKYENSYQRVLSYDKAIWFLIKDIVSELEIDATALAEKVAEYPSGSIKRREMIRNRYG